MNRRLVVIGLDGATFDVLFPLMQRGYLPNIKSLMENGVYGELESTIPPITGPAWTALATGLNPGKTGIIDFLNRRGEDYKLKAVSSYDLKGRAFWDYLNRNGFKIGIFNYPMLFPPYEINGFMISGLGSSAGDDITYPKALKKKLDEIAGGYENNVYYHQERYNEDLFLKDAYRVLNKQRNVIDYLLKKESYNVLVCVISHTDWMQHFFWKHIDKTHPLYDPQRSPKYGEEFIKLLSKIDELIGDILKAFADANVFIVSDHGFGPQDQCFNLARWLIDQGYMVLHKGHKKEAKDTLHKFFRVMKSLAPRSIYKLGKSMATSLKTNIVDIIDFENSKAFCLGHTIPFGAIYLRENKNSSACKELKRKITGKLLKLGNELGRNDIKVDFFPPKKFFTGSKLEILPNIIFTINNWRCIIEENNVNKPIFVDESYSPRHTGTHRLNGIFIANGPAMKDEGRKIDGLKIYDMFPTILYLMGCDIPGNDGRVSKEIFKEGFRRDYHERKRYTEQTEKKEAEFVHLDEAEEEKIRERLKALGYL